MQDPTEVDSRDARPTRSSGLTFVGLLVGAVMVTMVLGQLTSPDASPRPPTTARITLENLALRITLDRLDTSSDGRPSFWAMDGFTAATAIPYGSPVVHEMRYATVNLGQESQLGDGQVYAGVTSGASFESLAFEAHAKQTGSVRGRRLGELWTAPFSSAWLWPRG